MEGRFWKCSWERGDGTYVIWVVPSPKIRAAGKSWQGALDSICEAIGNASGDGEPVLSFDPPEPIDSGDGAFAHPDWLFLGVNGWLQADTDRPELFSKGFCEHCGAPRGDRTDIPIAAKSPGEGDLCCPAINPYTPVIFSQRLLEALSSDERDGFRWIPVTPAPRTRKKYFECIPLSIVSPVAVRGITVKGSECPECDDRNILCTTDKELNFQTPQIHSWVAGEDLPRSVAGMLAFGRKPSWDPLLPTERARYLAREFSGLRPDRIALCPPDRVVRRPQLVQKKRIGTATPSTQPGS
jgi:hypothetical protein